MIRNFLLFLSLIIGLQGYTQSATLSETAEVSILTMGPGTQLYDAFGHSAFRVSDSDNGLDIVYNYGIYDFNTPNFYLKFARGQLFYELGVNNYQPFFEYYKRQNRYIKEQVLNLSTEEKQELFDFLQNNVKPENKKYLYDFFFDNCATKIRDVLQEVLGDKLEFKQDHITQEYTFRQLIQKNVPSNSWGSLGMDIAIGSVVDRKAKPIEYQFLPEYVYQGANNAVLRRNSGNEQLVSDSISLFEAETLELKSRFISSPLVIFSLLGFLILMITARDYKYNRRHRIMDMMLFIITGAIGIFLLLLWFGTDHSTTVNNYNLLWATPLSVIFAFFIGRKKPKNVVKRYVFFLLILLALMTVHWITGVQVFAIGLIPLLVALAIRYLFILRYLKKTATDL